MIKSDVSLTTPFYVKAKYYLILNNQAKILIGVIKDGNQRISLYNVQEIL